MRPTSSSSRSTAKGATRRRVKARHKERKREDKARAKDDSTKPRAVRARLQGRLAGQRGGIVARGSVGDLARRANRASKCCCGSRTPAARCTSTVSRRRSSCVLKQHGLKLLVAVDKVAASGGYLMACVADRLIAAPFAIVGSIGVLAQLPNFHRLLEEKGVDFEQVTAGRYKRTLTMFGKNTDEGREKLQQEVEDIHELFKSQIREHRPQVDVERVATGEHWYGIRALELKLVDELKTSDDLLLEAAKDHDLYHLAYKRRRSWQERVLGGAESLLTR